MRAIACEVLGFEADARVRATGPGLTNSDGGQRTHGLLRRALARRSLFDERPDSLQWHRRLLACSTVAGAPLAGARVFWPLL